jgi:hypothetical protein
MIEYLILEYQAMHAWTVGVVSIKALVWMSRDIIGCSV